MTDPIEIMTRDQIIEHMDIARRNASAVTGHSQKKHHLAIVALCSLALRGLDVKKSVGEIEVLIEGLIANNSHAFNEGIEEAAKEAERWGDAGVSAATIIRQKSKPL